MDRFLKSLRIANELAEFSAEIPELLAQIGEASKTATEAQKIDLEFLAKRITERFSKASEMADTDVDDVDRHRLNEAVQGVRDEITRAKLILNRLSSKT
jgi:hypothetical protein